MSGEGARRRAVVAVIVAAATIALVTVVASGARVPLATEGSGGWHLATRDRSRSLNERPTITMPPVSREPIDLPSAGSFSVLLDAVLIAGAIVLLLAGGQAMRRAWSSPKAARAPQRQPEERALPAPPALVDALDEGLGTLAAGPVDDVVIACWVQVEDAAAAAGVPRRTSETSSELASRVLTDLHAPQVAVDRLLDRYRTARYSRHPLGEDDRAVAIRSLQDIRGAIAGVHR